MSLIQPMHENLGKRLGSDCSECMVVWELGYAHNQQLTICCMVTRLAGCVLIMCLILRVTNTCWFSQLALSILHVRMLSVTSQLVLA